MLRTKFHAERASLAAFIDNVNMTMFAFRSHSYFTDQGRIVD